MTIPKILKKIAEAIKKAGGEAFLVGGTVRDELFKKFHNLNLKSKDIDVEVFGIPTEDLLTLLKTFGKVKLCGESFAVLKLTIGELDFDFSLPRSEVKTGAGHKDFKIVADHTMTIEQAVLRRDFTINAIMKNILTGQIIDLVGGVADIKAKLLRHVSKAFAEDALRVLRGFQFAARFGLTMVEETIEMCKSLKPEFHKLSKERLFEEWSKFICKGIFFNHGLDILKATEWSILFPMLDNDAFGSIHRHLSNLPIDGWVGDNQQLIVGLATIEDICGSGLMKQIVDDKQIVREVKELLKMSEGIMGKTDLSQALCVSIGLNKKFCSLETIKRFFRLQFSLMNFIDLVVPLTDKILTPHITGAILIENGWNPKVQKQAFGKELKRLHKLQLESRLSKEEMLNAIGVI